MGEQEAPPPFKLKRDRRGRVKLTAGTVSVDLGPFDQAATVMVDWLASEDFGERS